MGAEPKKITEIFAWICTEPDGGEGIPAVSHDGLALPLVGADRARIESLRPYAQRVAHELGLPVRLMRFSGMEVLEQISAPSRHESEA